MIGSPGYSKGVPQAAGVFMMPLAHPQMTWGMGDQRHSYEPGPGGPLLDNRAHTLLNPGPVYGRVGSQSILRAFSPGNIFPMLNPWPQQIVNNAYATALLSLYVPGWYKPQPTPYSGF